MTHIVLLLLYNMAQMQLLLSRYRWSIYENKQDNWHLVANHRPVKEDHTDCFDGAFVWQREFCGDANTVPALLQTHITPKGTLLIRPCMFLVQPNILQYCCKSSRFPNTQKK